jgi:putative ATPase
MRRRDRDPDLFTAFGDADAADTADGTRPRRNAPLADRMRPRTIAEFLGQEHLLDPGRILRDAIERHRPPSLILWGPPGSGKTTLAHLVAGAANAHFVPFSAVLGGIAELRRIVEEARDGLRRHGRATVLFVDEIHRFNKAQQDAFLPHVEDGTITLIGATTENPSFEIIPPLLSRTRVLVLEPLSPEAIRTILERACADAERGLGQRHLTLAPAATDFLVEHSQGDARIALNALEVAADLAAGAGRSEIDLTAVEEAAQHRALRYDRAGEEHYNLVSALIKSLRGSDPDAAVYWLVRMLEGGEDPLFIARRMVIFAAEDIGNADPGALQVAIAAKDAVHFVGLPEGRIPLAQAATYLATAPKSNAAYRALLAATADVKEHGQLPVPLELRNAPTPMMKAMGYGSGYLYPHDHEGAIVEQRYLPEALADRRYYEPGTAGHEAEIKARLEGWAKRRAAAAATPGSRPDRKHKGKS